ncbi:unnamed protein product [Darwinula stevensoni]|uniref:C-type lectin domain-containing protein n=1 Tax=Darwinula stevensoni TaxID=69355 RepID=A0A7R8X5P4_9CRUS|nr:unnamed protein product [Darwinula stevensoni]CAG0884988.1 unnamed protein product [Darwinula stevensoni]
MNERMKPRLLRRVKSGMTELRFLIKGPSLYLPFHWRRERTAAIRNPPLVSAPQNGLVYVENSIPPGIETGDGSHSVVGNATDAGDDENVVYLDFPDPRLCSQRPGHEKFDGHYYYLSWRDPTFDHFLSWLEGRNFCRRMCMDLVSLETPEENLFVTGLFESAASQGVTNSTWTSGLVCNFPGCEAEELQPARENGWFWSGSGVRISAKGSPTGFTDWSTVGGAGSGQPDDLEGEENCIALFGPTVYGDPDGHPHWHDVSCHTDRDVVCEDDPKLIEYVKTNYDISFQRK